MAGLTALNSFVVQVEGVARRIEEAIEKTAKLAQALGTGRDAAERMSTHAFRIPIQTDLASTYFFNNPDGGPLLQGSSSKWAQFTAIANPYAIPIMFSMLAQWTTDGKGQAVISPVAKTLADVTENAAKIRDLVLQGPGDGSIAQVDSVNGLTITVRGTQTTVIDGRGAHLMDRNQQCQIMSGGGGYVPRGNFTINECFKFAGGAQSITVDAVPGGTVAGDLIFPQGLPGGAPIGISGIQTLVNTSTTGTLNGLPRSLSYVQANGVNANSSQLSIPMLRIGLNQVIARLSDKALDGCFWHVGYSQLQAYEELGWQLQYVPLEGGKAGGLDLMFKKGGKSMEIDGKSVMENIHGDFTRFDLLNKKAWLMVKFTGTSPFWLKKKGTGDPVFTVYDPGTGQITTNEAMYLQEAYQWAPTNPGIQGGVFALKAPAGN